MHRLVALLQENRILKEAHLISQRRTTFWLYSIYIFNFFFHFFSRFSYKENVDISTKKYCKSWTDEVFRHIRNYYWMLKEYLSELGSFKSHKGYSKSRNRQNNLNSQLCIFIFMFKVRAGFEPAIPSLPSWCFNQAKPPDHETWILVFSS